MSRYLKTSRNKNFQRGLEQSSVRFQAVQIYHIDGVRQRHIDEWKSLGELGQYLAGIAAGYSAREIQKAREWDELKFRQIVSEATNLLDGKRTTGGKIPIG